MNDAIGNIDVAARMQRPGKVIGLVSAAHFISHFYILLLPPLFPLLRTELSVSFVQLGFAITVFNLTTAIFQPPLGFVVDRYDAGRILLAGVIMQSIAIAAIGWFASYGSILVLMILLGLGNAVYHPADYSILNKTVAAGAIGRAFSVHTFAGYLGYAVAPVSIAYLVTFLDWGTALSLCAGVGGAVAILLAAHSKVFKAANDAQRSEGKQRTTTLDGIRLLLSTPVLLGLLFFALMSLYGSGVGEFGVSVLNEAYGTSLTTSATIISVFLFAAPIGVLLGGSAADRIHHHENLIALCIIGAGALTCVAAGLTMSIQTLTVVLAVAGLLSGFVAPSRDKLIWSMTPAGDVGKVFGFVSSGFTISGVIAPILFGYLLDNSPPRLVFWTAGGFAFATAACVIITGRYTRR